MDPVLLAVVIIGLLLFLAAFGLLFGLLTPRLNLKERLQTRSRPVENKVEWKNILSKASEAVKPLGGWIPRSPEEMSKQELRLVQAGFRRKDAVYVFYGSSVVLFFVFLIGLKASGQVESNILLLVLTLLLAASVPDMALKKLISNRRQRIEGGLPDVMDLTVVSVEAGLGLDQALRRIGQEVKDHHTDISDELRLYHLEVRAGKGRVDALRNLAKRTDVQDLRSLVAVLIQTERFGTSIAQSLRVFSENMRTKRRQRAEEQAAKMTVKMVVPMILFILPAMFIVTVGPAVIALARQLAPALGGQG